MNSPESTYLPNFVKNQEILNTESPFQDFGLLQFFCRQPGNLGQNGNNGLFCLQILDAINTMDLYIGADIFEENFESAGSLR